MTRYGERRAELAEEHARLSRRSRRMGTLRGAAFVAALVLWVGAEFAWLPAGAGWAALAPLAVFVALVGRHGALRRGLRRVEAAQALAAEGEARLARRWDDLPSPQVPEEGAGPAHPYAVDLDLFGRVSVRALLGPTATPTGRALLDGWLLTQASPEVVEARQGAVRELAAAHRLREEVAVEGRLLDPPAPRAVERFLAWCGDGPAVSPGLAAAAWLLPALTGVGVAADLLGVLPGWPWALGVAAQGGVAWTRGKALHTGFSRASVGLTGLRRYHRLFRRWEGERPADPLLAERVGELRGDVPASRALEHLGRLLHLADTRLSILHSVVAVGVLWDVHVARALDGWRRDHGARVARWLEVQGELEALAALATLAADHPDWCWPEVGIEGDLRVVATGLAHPLIPPDRRVPNDVAVGPPGTVLLVTGSNMSGKSTLLRSLGLGVVLAGAGAPVCAAAFRMPRVRLFTSMRTQDSVGDGVSLFMAELLRLQALLEEAPRRAGGPLLVYLVDEILHGTNSQERRLAARRLIRHMLRRHAVGAVTSHDLELHRDPEVEPRAELVHFRESVAAGDDGPGLTFDYRLRPGLATTRNALELAERVGLTDPGADAGAGALPPAPPTAAARGSAPDH